MYHKTHNLEKNVSKNTILKIAEYEILPYSKRSSVSL